MIRLAGAMAVPSGFPAVTAALPAAASAGVLVMAPAKVPAIRAGPVPSRRPTPTATPAAATRITRRMASGPPAVRSTWKKLGPELTPIAKVKMARPSVPSGAGISRATPSAVDQAANAMPTKSTAAAPRPTPLTLTCPTSIPRPMRTNSTRTGLSAR